VEVGHGQQRYTKCNSSGQRFQVNCAMSWPRGTMPP
jgi:hypothetical protein